MPVGKASALICLSIFVLLIPFDPIWDFVCEVYHEEKKTIDMSMKKHTAATQAAAQRPLPEVPAESMDQLVKGPMTPIEVQDLFLSFQKAVIEWTMAAERNQHRLS